MHGFVLALAIVGVALLAGLAMWMQGTGFRDYLRRRRGQ